MTCPEINVVDVTSSNIFRSFHLSMNSSNRYSIANRRKRKIKVCLSAMENPFELLIQE